MAVVARGVLQSCVSVAVTVRGLLLGSRFSGPLIYSRERLPKVRRVIPCALVGIRDMYLHGLVHFATSTRCYLPSFEGEVLSHSQKWRELGSPNRDTLSAVA